MLLYKSEFASGELMAAVTGSLLGEKNFSNLNYLNRLSFRVQKEMSWSGFNISYHHHQIQ